MTSPHALSGEKPRPLPEPPASDQELPTRPLAAGDEPEFPRAFGGYALLAKFAQGGMGEVFLAKSGGVAGIDRLCVLKKLRGDVTKNEEYVRRFLDEARVAVQLNHANISHIFDVGQVRDEYFLAMEYVSGVNLRKLLTRAGERAVVVDEDVALYIVRETLEALDYAHRHRHPLTGKPLNLVHRDVSPQNVMLNYEGEVKLIDFGLAESDLKEEETESKVVMGKVRYMSPEQARGERVDGRTDQFAAAIIAYELLAGERYYGEMNAYDIWQVVGRGGFVPKRFDDIDPRLQVILRRALSPKTSDRFASCGAFQDALDAYMTEGTGRRSAQRLMRTLFEKDHDAERRFLQKFVDVKVPSTDELSPREGSNRPFVLDDGSRPTTMEEAAALAEAKDRASRGVASPGPGDVTKTLTAQDAKDLAATGAPLSSQSGPTSDPTEIVRSRTDVAAQSRAPLESSDTRAAAAAAYPNRTKFYLAAAGLTGITLGVLLFLMLRDQGAETVESTNAVVSIAQEDGKNDVVTPAPAAEVVQERVETSTTAANAEAEAIAAREKAAAGEKAATEAAAQKAAAAKAAAEKAAAETAAAEAAAAAQKAAAEAAAAEKAAAEKAAADKAAAEKAAAEKAAAEAAAAAEKAKLTLPKEASKPFSYAAIREALRGCKQVCATPQLRLIGGKKGTVPMVERTGLLNCARQCQK